MSGFLPAGENLDTFCKTTNRGEEYSKGWVPVYRRIEHEGLMWFYLQFT